MLQSVGINAEDVAQHKEETVKALQFYQHMMEERNPSTSQANTAGISLFETLGKLFLVVELDPLFFVHLNCGNTPILICNTT